MNFPKKVKIVEVSPRDGLQNEKKILPAAIKIDLVQRLADTGLTTIETTSFVSPQWIPQLADAKEVYSGIDKKSGVSYPVLIPNVRGLENALSVGVQEIAVFTTPSEQFSQKNTHCSVAESLERIRAVMQLAKAHHLRVRGYLSCVLGCPYEGEMSADKVSALAEQLYQLGCDEISLGDTIGTGTPFKTAILIETVMQKVPVTQLAMHFHDTYGQALTNLYVGLSLGVSVIDSSVAGIGGCPYAQGATGNVATEDVIYMLQGMGIETDVDLGKLIHVGQWIAGELGIKPHSKVSVAQAER